MFVLISQGCRFAAAVLSTGSFVKHPKPCLNFESLMLDFASTASH